MNINREHLQQASAQGLLSEQQADQLWLFLQAQQHDTPGFRLNHVLYYLGGLIAIGAMTLFMTVSWERFGGWGLFFIALAYASAGLWLTEHLLYRQRLAIPAGVIATFVVVLTPLAIYGLQVGMGWWAEGRTYEQFHRQVDWRWLFMEWATLAVAAVMLWRYRLPFLVMPVAVTLWYMSMDLALYLFPDTPLTWELRKFVSLWFGLLMGLLAFWVDVRTRQSQDYAFWLYLFGVTTFWGGLSLMQSDSEWQKFGYFAINILMIFIGVALSRRVFAVFGGLGAAGYLSYLSHRVFQDSLLFPFALTFIGLGVVYLGILWQKHETAWTAQLRRRLPGPMQQWLGR